jgi:hypothetical protein
MQMLSLLNVTSWVSPAVKNSKPKSKSSEIKTYKLLDSLFSHESFIGNNRPEPVKKTGNYFTNDSLNKKPEKAT